MNYSLHLQAQFFQDKFTYIVLLMNVLDFLFFVNISWLSWLQSSEQLNTFIMNAISNLVETWTYIKILIALAQGTWDIDANIEFLITMPDLVQTWTYIKLLISHMLILSLLNSNFPQASLCSSSPYPDKYLITWLLIL